jgi:hypothetical protein
VERRKFSAARDNKPCDERFALEPPLKNSAFPENSSPQPNLPQPTVAALREAVLKVAILGTARQSLDAEKIGAGTGTDSLSQLLAQLDFSDRENSVFNAAALLFQYERAGQMPLAAGDSRPPQCLTDETPRCNAAASTGLAALLQQTQSPLLAEWLRVAAECGLRAPEEHLPALLDAGKQSRDLRPLVIAVIGNRGRWLAAQNPAWSYAVEVSREQAQSDEIWQTGTKAERLSFLKYWREHDAARARELLASTWKQEPSEERAQFIATFEIGLSAADEPFLEDALDDKRKEVRQSAAEFLARLPQSRLVARNFERLKNILSLTATSKLKKLIGRGAVIEVALPKEFDKAMARDGIEEKWYGSGKQGQKAGWVQQMVSVVPPTFWEREWNLSPHEIIQAASAGEWKHPLLQGFAQAASLHHSADWLEAFFEEAVTNQYLTNSFGALPNLTNAFGILPRERLERLILMALKNHETTKDQDVVQRLHVLLTHHKTPWSHEFARAVLDATREEIRNVGTSHEWLCYSLPDWAFWIPPELYGEAATGWPIQTEHWPKWEPVVNKFLQILETRRDMRRELRESGQQ